MVEHKMEHGWLARGAHWDRYAHPFSSSSLHHAADMADISGLVWLHLYIY